MAQITLSAPLTLNPTTATKLVVRSTTIEHGAKVISIQVDMVDADGAIVEQRTVQASGAAVATWIANQEATIVARLLAKLGVTGTIG